MPTIILLCVIASIIASVLTIAASMLSSRISQAQYLLEEYDDYETEETTPGVSPHTYPVEG